MAKFLRKKSNPITELKKELWVVNTKIAHSYEKSFKKFL